MPLPSPPNNLICLVDAQAALSKFKRIPIVLPLSYRWVSGSAVLACKGDLYDSRDLLIHWRDSSQIENGRFKDYVKQLPIMVTWLKLN